ncbi:hypothetical protein KC878_02000 [Candidatus Saccharibacteria bacterium]|nr:hypothetical protein [Candidatus Saccharibacteria bacterium]MCB9821675.1 hypothetical protein [Candidatus Nomurabacteria bacterium]
MKSDLAPRTSTRRPETAMWDSDPTPSQRVGTAAVMGVYGPKIRKDEALIARAFSPEGLSADEITALEALRDQGVAWRFGPEGLFWTMATPELGQD